MYLRTPPIATLPSKDGRKGTGTVCPYPTPNSWVDSPWTAAPMASPGLVMVVSP